MKREKKERDKIKVIAIGGPTASGKTAASLCLAKIFHGAVINCDSRQIYREIDISTDKIPYTLPYQDPINYEGIDHYGINITDLNHTYTLYDWLKYTHDTIDKIVNIQQITFLVGGTGLYIQAIADNYELKSDFDQSLRDKLAKYSLKELQEKLLTLDKNLYKKIDCQNPRRLIRAIEKCSLKLKVKSEKSIKNNNLTQPKFECLVLSFFPNREEIKKKIALRIEEHLKKGVLDEVKSLVEKYGPEHPILNATISVQEYIPYILGKTTLEKAKELVKINNYHYVKRQMTWFRKYGNTVFCKDIKEMEEKIRDFLT